MTTRTKNGYNPPYYIKGELRKALTSHEAWPNAPIGQRIAHAMCDDYGALRSQSTGDLVLWLNAEGLEVVVRLAVSK